MHIKGAGVGGYFKNSNSIISPSSLKSNLSSGISNIDCMENCNHYGSASVPSQNGNVTITNASGPAEDFAFPSTSKIKDVAPSFKNISTNYYSKNNFNSDVKSIKIDTASGNKGTVTYVENKDVARRSIATIANFALSTAGGAFKVIEGVLDTGITAIGTVESEVASIFDSSYGESLRQTTKSLVEFDAIGSLTDKIADVTGIKKSSKEYENVKNTGFAIGDIGAKGAAMILSGGAAVPIIGLSDAGKSAEMEWTSGASYSDGLIAGGVSGAFSTVGWALGGKLATVSPFGNDFLDAAFRIDLNGFLGGLNGMQETVTSTLQRYSGGNDVSTKTPIEVFSEEAQKNYMLASFSSGALTALAFSTVGELAGLSKHYQDGIVKNVKRKIQNLASKKDDGIELNRITNAIEDQFFKAQSARDIKGIKLTRKVAHELFAENGVSDEAIADLLTDVESNGLKRIGYDSYDDEVSGLRINILKGLNEKKLKYTPESIIKHITNLPEELHGYVKEINIYDTLCPSDNYWQFKFGDASQIGSASVDGAGIISFWKGYDGGMPTVVHEIGHCYDKSSNVDFLWRKVVGQGTSEYKISSSKGWKDAMEADFREYGKRGVTEYATSNEAEDFAETVMTYYTNPECMKKFPNRKALIDNIRTFYENGETDEDYQAKVRGELGSLVAELMNENNE